MVSDGWVGSGLAPLLEQAHPLAATIGAPQVAAAAGTVAAVIGPVVAVAAASYAAPPEHVEERGCGRRGRRRPPAQPQIIRRVRPTITITSDNSYNTIIIRV